MTMKDVVKIYELQNEKIASLDKNLQIIGEIISQDNNTSALDDSSASYVKLRCDIVKKIYEQLSDYKKNLLAILDVPLSMD